MSDSSSAPAGPRRRRFVPLVWLASIGALGLLGLGVGGSLSGFTASITNNGDTAASGNLLMEEDSGATTCLSTANGVSTNAANCAINKFGGSTVLVPGGTASTTTITIKNDGTVPANTFTLTPGACTQGTNGTVNGNDAAFCGKVDVTITSGATTIFTGTAASLASHAAFALAAAPVAPGGSVSYTFAVSLDSSATNADQGLSASEPLTWAFGS